MNFRLPRGAVACAVFAIAALGVSGCAGGGATTGSAPNPSTSAGSGSGSGSTTATATPTANSGTGSGSGSATATPSASASSTPGSGGSATASPTPTATPAGSAQSTATPSSLDTIDVVPAVIDGDLGGIAQIGILDPTYSGPYTVNVTGGGLLGNALNTLGNVVNGTLQGNSSGETTLTLNLANALQLGLLGPNGNAITICEQQNPSTCKSVTITNNSVVPMVGSTVSSIVFSPSGIKTLTLIAPLLNLTSFNIVTSPQGITVTNLGDGMFIVDAAANIGVPTTGNITISDGMGHTVTIPVSVL